MYFQSKSFIIFIKMTLSFKRNGSNTENTKNMSNKVKQHKNFDNIK